MSRQELAEAVNAHVFEHTGRVVCVDGCYIGRLERGKSWWPSPDYRAALRAVLGVATDAELGFRRSPPGTGTTVSAAPPDAPGAGRAAGGRWRRLRRWIGLARWRTRR